MSDFSFKVSKCQIQKFPIWHVIFVMLSWHILCFCKTFMMSKCPHTVIWRHVKCIYKGIIDLRFEFVWPKIFHLSGKYFEKQLIGICQMPHISPLIAMIESTKNEPGISLWVNCLLLVLGMKKIFKRNIFWYSQICQKSIINYCCPSKRGLSKEFHFDDFECSFSQINPWFCCSFYLLTSSLQ